METYVEVAEKILNGKVPVPEGEELRVLVERLKKQPDYIRACKVLSRASRERPKHSRIARQLRDCLKEFVERILDRELEMPAHEEFEYLVKELKGQIEFGLGRKILAKGREREPANTWIVQQLAFCTYKDEELLPKTRFEEALKLLEEIGLRDPEEAVKSGKVERETLAETIALGGAVYKRMWEFGGTLDHLYQALAFYRETWEKYPEDDKGYGGVNAAYILDILAARAETLALRSGIKPAEDEEALELKKKALKLRSDMSVEVPEIVKEKEPEGLGEYWYLVTMAEIWFGLEKYEEARKLLAKARDTDAKEWERQTTFKQLVALARLQGVESPAERSDVEDWHAAWQALYEFLGEGTDKALSCSRGKVGLALSGGGFRASLFHLGVLARLAEMDVLRSVEALSTVSGGSIVGMLYYLEVQNLIKKYKDSDISREKYIGLVRRVLDTFFHGIRCNLRTRALANLRQNLAMIYSKEYSRSHRLGELFEEKLYSTIGEDGIRRIGKRTMPELLIDPKCSPDEEEFKPKFSNWRRRSKVPVLLINSTSLNSGHSWHFTARWMGEPPGSVTTEVDVNERYRRLWYDQAPETRHQEYRVGYAVAASACVPGLFEPLVLEGLYPGRTVRLVDGGVHDNQGVEALLDEGCTLILCSDASGQMEDQKDPSDTVIGVPLRSNSILMDRIREAEYQDLRARLDSGAIHGLFFAHLKKGLETLPIDWIDCDDPTIPPQKSPCTTDYGVDKELQRKLADIRTDLDSFSEIEAYSLMLSGYLMTEHEFLKLDMRHKRDKGYKGSLQELEDPKRQEEADGEFGTWGEFDVRAPRGDWPFLDLENLIRQPPDSSDMRRAELERHLEIGSHRLLKVWELIPQFRQVSWFLGAAVALGLVALITTLWNEKVPYCDVLAGLSWGQLITAVALLLASVIWPIAKWLQPEKALKGWFYKAVIAVIGWITTNVHLAIFDPLFLEYGKLERLMRLRSETLFQFLKSCWKVFKGEKHPKTPSR